MSFKIMLFLSSLVIGLYYIKNGYKRYTIFYWLLTLPIIYFSLNYIDQAQTIDEIQYINAFSNMYAIERGTKYWFKGTYQYRISEIFSGTICLLVRKFFDLSETRMILVYKYSHYALYLGVVLIIAQIWKKIYAYEEQSIRYRISNAATLMVLIGSPISCLLLKVCNYDAGCVLFGIAGLSFIILADKHENVKIAFVGTIVASLSCLEKWGGLPYWCVCAAAVGAIAYKKTKKIKNLIIADLTVIISSYVICWFSLIYIRLLQGQGIVDINIGAALFPLFIMVKFFLSYGPINNEEIGAYDNIALPCIMFLIVAIIAFALIIECFRKLYDKYHKNRLLRIFCTSVLLCIVSGAITACFIVARQQYPFIDIPDGIYVPNASMNGTTCFYDVKTAFGYYLASAFYALATCIANMPTTYMVVFVLACAIFIGMKKVRDDEYGLFLTGVFGLVLPILYVWSGTPATPRYFGVSILLMQILSIYILGKYVETNRLNGIKCVRWGIKIGAMVCYVLILVEMCLYTPNYTSFAPIWLYRSNEFKTSVRQGEKAVGESMMWGEDLAIAGNEIRDLLGKDVDYSQYTIYYSYGREWIKNPGFNIKSMRRGLDNLSWTENDYYIFTKFRIYRKEIPEFIFDLEPDITVSNNGEIAVWIYRGDRIREYSSYFE